MCFCSLRSKKEAQEMVISSPVISPTSEKRFWNTLRNRIDVLRDNNNRSNAVTRDDHGETNQFNGTNEESVLLLKGFESITHTLSCLSSNLENALEGATSLADTPTSGELFQSIFSDVTDSNRVDSELVASQNGGVEDKEKGNIVNKRKFDLVEITEAEGSPKNCKLKKAKHLAVSMASKAASLATELKSIKSDLCSLRGKYALLKEENMMLRDGCFKSGAIVPEEDELMRLQMEALLAEKSRLTSENADLQRENQCLHQLVEYHQHTSHNLSASLDQAEDDFYLQFSSPSDTPSAPASSPYSDSHAGQIQTPQVVDAELRQ